jgi:UDP-N-acetyl-D-mannosaminuronate dehydrogenase
VKIACFGLAFKPNIDDLRESPAMEIAQDRAGTAVKRWWLSRIFINCRKNWRAVQLAALDALEARMCWCAGGS